MHAQHLNLTPHDVRIYEQALRNQTQRSQIVQVEWAARRSAYGDESCKPPSGVRREFCVCRHSAAGPTHFSSKSHSFSDWFSGVPDEHILDYNVNGNTEVGFDTFGGGPLFQLVGPLDKVATGAQAQLEAMLVADPAVVRSPAAHDPSNHSLLNIAAFYGNAPAVRSLTAAGANVWHQDSSGGHTPLHHAVLCACNETTAEGIVQQLLSAGADVNIADAGGKRPLDHARSRSWQTVVGKLSLVQELESTNNRSREGAQQEEVVNDQSKEGNEATGSKAVAYETDGEGCEKQK